MTNTITLVDKSTVSEVTLKILPYRENLLKLTDALIEAGYDVNIEQVYDETFHIPKIKYFNLSISGYISFEENDELKEVNIP